MNAASDIWWTGGWARCCIEADRLLGARWQSLIYKGQAMCTGWRSQMAYQAYLLTTKLRESDVSRSIIGRRPAACAHSFAEAESGN